MIDISDEFTTWLMSANAGFLNPGSLHLFNVALETMPQEGAVVEIGSCAGLSLNAIVYYARRHARQNPIFSCDPWPFPAGTIPGTSIDRHNYRSFVIETFKRNVQFFSRDRLPHSVEASADDFFAKWSAKANVQDLFGREVTLGGPLAFCYIDGWHEYGAVRGDFENCDAHLVGGGLILFDDSGDDMTWEDVKRVVREVLETGRYDVVAKNPCYLLQKR